MNLKAFLLAFIAQFLICDIYAIDPVEINGILYYFQYTGLNVGYAVVTHPAHGDFEYKGHVEIPRSVTVNDITYPVKSIGYEAFSGDNELLSVSIPTSVTGISNAAFSDCKGLKSIYIPASVTGIGENAFKGCTSLESVELPGSLKEIRAWTFDYCTGLKSVSIPSSITRIGQDAFGHCNNLKEVHIYDLAAWCNISLWPHDNPLYYAHHLFLDEEEIKDLVIPETVTSINQYAFEGCSGLTSVTIPENVTELGDCVFDGCSGLTFVTLPESITKIPPAAFRDCSGLTSFSVPRSVTELDWAAFQNCTGLNEFYCFAENIPQTNEYAFFSQSQTIPATLHVPESSIEAYKSTYPWSKFRRIVSLDFVEEPVTVTADDLTMCYGDDRPSLTFTSVGEELEGSPSLRCSVSKTSPVGNYPINISRGSVINGKATFVDGTMTVKKAPLTITANSFTINQGDDLPAFIVTYMGFKNGEKADILTKQPIITCLATDSNTPGTYKINVSDAEADNYDITYVAGILTINKSSVDVEDINNNKLYTLTCKRGEMVVNAAGTGLTSSKLRTYTTDRDKHFALITYNDAMYLYSPSLRKYIQADGSFANRVGVPIVLDDSHADGLYKFMLHIQNGGTKYFNCNGNGNIVIDSWSTPDDGNRWKIEAVTDFDPSEALAMFNVKATSITLNQQTLYFATLGDTKQLTAKIQPVNVSDPSVKWTSSDNSVVTVNQNGLVTAIGNGTAFITVSTQDGSDLSATCEVTVRTNATSIINDLAQLSNAKQYLIHTRNKVRGSLGTSNGHLATTNSGATVYKCSDASSFAIIKYENEYYLFSVQDNAFITNTGNETEKPGKSGQHALIIEKHDNYFVLNFKSTGYTINVNFAPGIEINSWGSGNGMYDDGNLLTIEEVGDFEATAALAMFEHEINEVTEEQYHAAVNSIKTDQAYYVYALYNGVKYYLTQTGYLTSTLNDNCLINFEHTEGKDLFRSPGWKANACFTNPMLENGATGNLRPQGHILTDSQNRNDWEGQVWYMNDFGCYAVRATNAVSNLWGASTFWTILDLNSDGKPEADYTYEPSFVWQLEEDKVDDINAIERICNRSNIIYNLSGQRLSKPQRGVNIIGGKKVVVK